MRPFCTDVGFCSGSLADAGLLCARLDSKPQLTAPEESVPVAKCTCAAEGIVLRVTLFRHTAAGRQPRPQKPSS